jgi:hypothetical protein
MKLNGHLFAAIFILGTAFSGANETTTGNEPADTKKPSKAAIHVYDTAGENQNDAALQRCR